jgi:hypothetical protein
MKNAFLFQLTALVRIRHIKIFLPKTSPADAFNDLMLGVSFLVDCVISIIIISISRVPVYPSIVPPLLNINVHQYRYS